MKGGCVKFSFVPKTYFTDEARGQIERAIAETAGMEVFFVGSLGEDGVVFEVKAAARGDDSSTPAVVDAAAPGEVVIHNHPSGNLTPSDQDVRAASIFGNNGVGFYIVSNDASEVYPVVEPFRANEAQKLNPDELRRALLPEGGVAGAMGGSYELRSEQIQMMEAVADAFNEDGISLIEAGTGTGKTLAYLIPALKWAIRNKERVVISTNTINLQEQLIEKDIPLLKSALGEDFKFSLVKGMGNYLCILRSETVQDGLFDIAEEGEVDSLKPILEWAKFTQDGSLADLGFTPSDEAWDKVSAESESCIRARCPYYSKCFFYKARREMASAQLLIVNHHLLFSDLSIKGASDHSDSGILPPYKRVIFDEGHHIADAATSHFGMRATKFAVIRALRRLKRRGGRGEAKGLIFYVASLATKLKKYFRKGILNNVLRKVEETLSPEIDRLEEYSRDAFDELYLFGSASCEGQNGGGGEEASFRVTDSVREREGWERVDKKFSILRIKLKELGDDIKAFTDVLSDYEAETEVARIIAEFTGVANKLGFWADVISFFLDANDDGYVRWVEARIGKGAAIFSGIGISPLDIAPHLKDKLYAKSKTVVMTSATMSVRGSFKFIKSTLGIEDSARLVERIIPSPFDYKKQAMVAVPDDMPEPTSRDFVSALPAMVLRAARASGGNALVLFTSYSLLESVAAKIGDELALLGMPLLKQGASPRARLLDRFRAEDKSVLFATDSFWEGVDVPGDALRLVVITRLPFRVPTEPVLEARVENMEKEGVNSFLDYTVPTAVLKFKQGFGRLIRTRSDRGAVLILDRRVISKSYGKYFLDSLPDCARMRDKSDKVIRGLERFFQL
ncbi:MAG: helicase C-terminal domain-containing protein [Deltaproteobacteria bacterium]